MLCSAVRGVGGLLLFGLHILGENSVFEYQQYFGTMMEQVLVLEHSRHGIYFRTNDYHESPMCEVFQVHDLEGSLVGVALQYDKC